MPDVQPLPDDITVDDLGESYLIVPYGVQFEGVNQPTPVSCIVYNNTDQSLTGYTITNSGSWKQVGKNTLTHEPVILHSQDQSIYQSVIGCIGEDWEALHEMDLLIQSLIDIDPNKLSELQEATQELPESREYTQFCSCASPKQQERQVYEIQNESITLNYCENCGGLLSVFGISNGKKTDTVSTTDGVTSLELIDGAITPEMITETNHPDLYLTTDTSQQYSEFDLLGTAHWWQSQKRNPTTRPFTSVEMNITTLNHNETIAGVILWSYLFGTYPIIHHINVNSDTPPIYRQKLLHKFATEVVGVTQIQDVLLTQPYTGLSQITSQFTPLKIVSGYVKVAGSIEEAMQ